MSERDKNGVYKWIRKTGFKSRGKSKSKKSKSKKRRS